MKSICLLWLALGPALTAFSQNDIAIKTLAIGDVAPDMVFDKMINCPFSSAKLSDFNGKLVILDFWATWCSSCIHNFPKLDSLQKQFDGQLQILLVNTKNTGDDEKKVIAFFDGRRMKNGVTYQLPTVLQDTIADRLFEHRSIPHYVWIDGRRNVIAITSSSQVTVENIQAILTGKTVKWSMKKDQDTDKPLFTGNDLPVDSLMQYSIFLKGNFDGLPTSNRVRNIGGIVRGKAMTNTSLLDMYQTVISFMLPGFNKKRMLLDLIDSSRIIPDTSSAGRENWDNDHSFSYDMIVPVNQADKLYTYMLEDLNRYSGYDGKIEKRRVKCLVLRNSKLVAKISSREGGSSVNNLRETEAVKYLHNQPISDLVNYLDAILPLPVLDESNFTQHIDLRLPVDLTDIPGLQTALSKYGLTLAETERELDMFVLSEKRAR
jgi:thiol-disulfide isomerase/thioredoxin